MLYVELNTYMYMYIHVYAHQTYQNSQGCTVPVIAHAVCCVPRKVTNHIRFIRTKMLCKYMTCKYETSNSVQVMWDIIILTFVWSLMRMVNFKHDSILSVMTLISLWSIRTFSQIWHFCVTYSTHHVYLHRPNAFGFWQTRFELFWIGLRIRNAFGMNRNCTFCVCPFRKFWSVICERWVGLVSVSVLVSETAGQIHLSDNMRCKGIAIWVSNVRCKMHQKRLQVKRTSRLRLRRKLKSVWK